MDFSKQGVAILHAVAEDALQRNLELYPNDPWFKQHVEEYLRRAKEGLGYYFWQVRMKRYSWREDQKSLRDLLLTYPKTRRLLEEKGYPDTSLAQLYRRDALIAVGRLVLESLPELTDRVAPTLERDLARAIEHAMSHYGVAHTEPIRDLLRRADVTREIMEREAPEAKEPLQFEGDYGGEG